jgi:Domain of unknown function (DUF222)/HNH endonuclease
MGASEEPPPETSPLPPATAPLTPPAPPPLTPPAPLPATPAAALVMLEAALDALNAADAASLPGAIQAECLRALERAEAKHTAARARVLASFTAQGGFEGDGQGCARSWLKWQTRITGGAAAAAAGWARRLAAHPRVARALAAGDVSASWAREICAWADLLPEGKRPAADEILLGAAAGGAALADLAGLAHEMLARCAGPGEDTGDGFEDRGLDLGVTFRHAGRLNGDLTPECTAALSAVLGALGKKAGPEDERTASQRRHDALEEACRRLIAAGHIPGRAGQPTQIQLHLTLGQLRHLHGADDTETAWAAGRAAGDGHPGWPTSRAAAQAYACDAQITPIVTGCPDPAALADMTTAYLDGAGYRPGCTCGRCTCRPAPGPLPPTTMRRLHSTLLAYAADVLSGPAGLAAFLRTRLLATEFPPAISLPLDAGEATSTVPPHLRRLVTARDRHCAAPGCTQPPAGCHVHHIIPRADGGPTTLGNLILLCTFHHLIAIHRWGWTITLHPDGTTTMRNPDGSKTFHSHSPPPATAAV